MNEVPDIKFDNRVFDLLDGVISPSDHALLEETLRHDSSARRRYIELTDLHDLLEQEADEAPSSLPEEASVDFRRHAVRRSAWKKVVRPALAAAALIVISVAIFHFTRRPAKSGEANFVATPRSSFSIHPANIGKEGPPGNTLYPGSSLELTQGSVELTFSSGVKSIVQAPASLTLVSPRSLLMREGRGWFQLPSKATDFEVATDQLQVVNLGTEFGVVADRGVRLANDEVHVFQGTVRAHSLRGLQESAIVAAGEARTTQDGGQISPVALAPAKFVEILPRGLPELHWRFDQHGTWDVDVNSTTAGVIATMAEGSPPQDTAGIKGGAMLFVPGGGHLRTTWRGVDSDRPRTVSCWIRCPAQQPEGSIVEWGIVDPKHPRVTSSKWRITLNPELEREGGVRGALRTEFGFGYVIGTTDLRDGRWHHITSVYDGSGRGAPGSIRLFVDGRPEVVSAFRANNIRTNIGDVGSSPCVIGSRFEGSLDELQIFEGILPDDAVLELAKPAASR